MCTPCALGAQDLQPARTGPALFTARYSNKNLAAHPGAKVRITLGHPRFKLPGYELAGVIRDLAPERSMFGRTQDEFTGLYRARLEALGGVQYFDQLLRATAQQAGADALVLLCFEDLRKADLFCHRRVFAAWWEEQTGQAVPELEEAV
jgi:hypothetical protein